MNISSRIGIAFPTCTSSNRLISWYRLDYGYFLLIQNGRVDVWLQTLLTSVILQLRSFIYFNRYKTCLLLFCYLICFRKYQTPSSVCSVFCVGVILQHFR